MSLEKTPKYPHNVYFSVKKEGTIAFLTKLTGFYFPKVTNILKGLHLQLNILPVAQDPISYLSRMNMPQAATGDEKTQKVT